jgi:hypothetical protein
MNIFFRSKKTPGEYYAASPNAEHRMSHISVIWELKKVGSDNVNHISTNELITNYEQCSPYEALSLTK